MLGAWGPRLAGQEMPKTEKNLSFRPMAKVCIRELGPTRGSGRVPGETQRCGSVGGFRERPQNFGPGAIGLKIRVFGRMPYDIGKSKKCPASRPWAVTKKTDGSLLACHETEAKASGQVSAVYASEAKPKKAK